MSDGAEYRICKNFLRMLQVLVAHLGLVQNNKGKIKSSCEKGEADILQQKVSPVRRCSLYHHFALLA